MKIFLTTFILALLAGNIHAAKSFPPASELPAQAELPDPLVMLDGKPVTSKKDWFDKRRPELKRLFQHYEYGFFPSPAKIKAKVEYADKNCFGGKATLKLVTISFAKKNAPQINLMLVVPNQKKNPAPVFLGLNFSGNFALVTNSYVPIPKGWMNAKIAVVSNNLATEAGRGKSIDVWNIEQSIDRGYAVATIFCDDIQPDQTNVTTGIRSFFHGS